VKHDDKKIANTSHAAHEVSNKYDTTSIPLCSFVLSIAGITLVVFLAFVAVRAAAFVALDLATSILSLFMALLAKVSYKVVLIALVLIAIVCCAAGPRENQDEARVQELTETVEQLEGESIRSGRITYKALDKWMSTNCPGTYESWKLKNKKRYQEFEEMYKSAPPIQDPPY